MLTLKCISTGSRGNMYLLSYNKEQLVMELGVDYNTFLLNLEDINNVVGCTLSHEHGDHLVKGMDKKMEDCGLTVLSYHNTRIGKRYKLKSFDIIPLPAKHNIECRAFLITCPDGVILFATDTETLPTVNIPVDFFIVEVNYIETIRQQIVLNGQEDSIKHLSGIYFNHHSLEKAVDYFEALKYTPQAILTIHKSNSGLFDTKTVVDALSGFSERVFVVNNNTDFILKE